MKLENAIRNFDQFYFFTCFMIVSIYVTIHLERLTDDNII